MRKSTLKAARAMADKTRIEWTDATWNPTTGCTQIPGAHGAPSGCDHCYAKTLIDTRLSKNPRSSRYGQPFETVMLHRSRLTKPLTWQRQRRIFVDSLSDLFHIDVSDEYVALIFDVMIAADWHTFQVLTKRPERMRRFVSEMMNAIVHHTGPRVALFEANMGRSLTYSVPAPNIWLGTSICSNDDAWRADMLRQTPATIRFLSLEPMLGPVDRVDFTAVDWIIVGGESGRGARAMAESWVRDVRDRCSALDVPFFFKQWGGETAKRGHEEAVLDGQRHIAWPDRSRTQNGASNPTSFERV
jgi:protein gp37